jgi:hypothetical protein
MEKMRLVAAPKISTAYITVGWIYPAVGAVECCSRNKRAESKGRLFSSLALCETLVARHHYYLKGHGVLFIVAFAGNNEQVLFIVTIIKQSVIIIYSAAVCFQVSQDFWLSYPF